MHRKYKNISKFYQLFFKLIVFRNMGYRDVQTGSLSPLHVCVHADVFVYVNGAYTLQRWGKQKNILGGSRKVVVPYNVGWNIKNKRPLYGKCLGGK